MSRLSNIHTCAYTHEQIIECTYMRIHAWADCRRARGMHQRNRCLAGIYYFRVTPVQSQWTHAAGIHAHVYVCTYRVTWYFLITLAQLRCVHAPDNNCNVHMYTCIIPIISFYTHIHTQNHAHTRTRAHTCCLYIRALIAHLCAELLYIIVFVNVVWVFTYIQRNKHVCIHTYIHTYIQICILHRFAAGGRGNVFMMCLVKGATFCACIV
jgi:hypothetical protein